MHRIDGAVSAFLRQHPEFAHLVDDLKSEGKVRLIDAVDRFIAGRVTNFNGYLRLCIRSGLWEAARTDDVIQSPRNCSARQSRDQELTTIFDYRVAKSDPVAEEQIIGEVCIDDVDKLLVSMLRVGNTLRNIAAELMISVEEAQSRKQGIESRILERM